MRARWCPTIPAEHLGELIGLISDNTISGKIAKDVFARMFAGEGRPGDIVEKQGLKQVTDPGAIEKIVDEVLAASPSQIADYKAGKDKMFGYFVGQIMKKSGGKANPGIVNDLLKAKLDRA
jgi:aspartyl-tRNA(Asn)/glutamyl-tRNA(Gln) amidotransferase subunit B